MSAPADLFFEDVQRPAEQVVEIIVEWAQGRLPAEQWIRIPLSPQQFFDAMDKLQQEEVWRTLNSYYDDFIKDNVRMDYSVWDHCLFLRNPKATHMYFLAEFETALLCKIKELTRDWPEFAPLVEGFAADPSTRQTTPLGGSFTHPVDGRVLQSFREPDLALKSSYRTDRFNSDGIIIEVTDRAKRTDLLPADIMARQYLRDNSADRRMVIALNIEYRYKDATYCVWFAKENERVINGQAVTFLTAQRLHEQRQFRDRDGSVKHGAMRLRVGNFVEFDRLATLCKDPKRLIAFMQTEVIITHQHLHRMLRRAEQASKQQQR